MDSHQGISTTCCMICLKIVTGVDLSKQAAVAKPLSDLFHIFLDCMNWGLKDGLDFDFVKESFPFCSHCHSTLLTIQRLHGQVQNIIKQIHGMVDTVNATVLMSEEANMVAPGKIDDDVIIIDDPSEDLNQQILSPNKNSVAMKKITHFRGKVCKSYKVKVDISWELQKEANAKLALCPAILSRPKRRRRVFQPRMVLEAQKSRAIRIRRTWKNPGTRRIRTIRNKAQEAELQLKIEAPEDIQEIKSSGMANVRKRSPGHCDRRFKFRYDSNTSSFRCLVCFHTTNSMEDIKTHIRQSHKEAGKRYICQVCGKSFCLQRHLEIHAAVHGKIPEVNGIASNLETIKRSNQEKMFQNDIKTTSDCPKKLISKGLSCRFCGESFGSSERLQDHTNIHTGNKPHKCNICGKAFRNRDVLEEHRDIHAATEKRYPCIVCGCTFTQVVTLNRHMRTHNDLEKDALMSVFSTAPPKTAEPMPWDYLLNGSVTMSSSSMDGFPSK